MVDVIYNKEKLNMRMMKTHLISRKPTGWLEYEPPHFNTKLQYRYMH